MSCDSGTDIRHQCRPAASRIPAIRLGSARRAFTLVELLIAILIALIFIGFMALTVYHIVRTGDVAQARLEALGNARHALETMSLEFKQARYGPVTATPANYFTGETTLLATGNLKDDDRDGSVDEETVDGVPPAGWTASDDLHAELTEALAPAPVYERQNHRGSGDLGDAGVDVDARYNRAKVSFRTFPSVFNPQPGNREVSFTVGTFDGEDNVLIRTVTDDAGGPGELITTSPLAFNVLSFQALYWNGNPSPPTWQVNWTASSFPATDVELPVSVFLEVTCYAGTEPLASALASSKPLDTVTLNTVVGIESSLADPRYAALRPVYP